MSANQPASKCGRPKGRWNVCYLGLILMVLGMITWLSGAWSKSRSSSAAQKRAFEYLISPKMRGMELVGAGRDSAKYQTVTDLSDLVRWIDISPLGEAAYPDLGQEAMYESIKNNLISKGDDLCLISGTYIFDVYGARRMVAVAVILEKGVEDKIEVETNLQEIQVL